MSRARAAGRFIPSEEVNAAVSWNFGAVKSPGAAAAWKERDETAQAREAAYAHGFEAGLAARRDSARREIDTFMQDVGQQTAQRLDGLVHQLAQELDGARQDVAVQILDLACEIARQVVRSELEHRPQAVEPAVQEALALIAQDQAPRSVRLHPDDLALVRPALESGDGAAAVTWRADPGVTRGGCVVEAGGTVIDATIEKRWMRAVANLGVPTLWQEAQDASI